MTTKAESKNGTAEKRTKKRKVFLTDDMKRKVLAEAEKVGDQAAAARYNVSPSAVSRWRTEGMTPRGRLDSDEQRRALLKIIELVAYEDLDHETAVVLIEALYGGGK